MAATAKAIIEGVSFGDTSGVQPYRVTGFDQPNGPQDFAVIQQCRQADGIPSKNTPHPNMPWLKVVDVQFSRFAKNFMAFVNVIYGVNTEQGSGSSTAGQWEIDSSVVSVRTELDYKGEPIKVIYNPTGQQGGLQIGREPTLGDSSQGAAVEQYVGMTTLRLTRTEATNPLSKSRSYTGKLNTNALDPTTDDAEAWLITKLGGVRPLTDDKWTVTYELQSVEDGWHKIAAYIEPTTGKPPGTNMGKITLANSVPRVRIADANTYQDRSQNGLTIVRVQGSADFSQLNFPPLDQQ